MNKYICDHIKTKYKLKFNNVYMYTKSKSKKIMEIGEGCEMFGLHAWWGSGLVLEETLPRL